MKNGMKMVIAEDDSNILDLLKMYMTKEGFTVATAANGSEALVKFRTFKPDIMLLDIMMPGLSGLEVCASVRKESKIPVIMLTAKGETSDKVKGLENGADDYIVKPFEMSEVIARVNAVLRRYNPDTRSQSTEKCLVFDKLVINMESYQLLVDGVPVEIPPKEIELLFFLAKNANRVFTRDQLLDNVWGFDYFGDTRTVDVHVKRLREKLKDISTQWTLKTVWGVGYKFEVHES